MMPTLQSVSSGPQTVLHIECLSLYHSHTDMLLSQLSRLFLTCALHTGRIASVTLSHRVFLGLHCRLILAACDTVQHWGWRYCCFWSDHGLDQDVTCTKQLELTCWKQNSIETWLQWLFVEWCYYKLHWISYWKQSSKDCVWNCIWTASICGLVSFIITTTRSAFCIMCSVLFKTLFKFSWCPVV